MWGKLYSFFRSIKNVLIACLFLIFLCSILASLVSPLDTLFFAPFGLLFFPLFIATLIVGLIYSRRSKWIAFSALILMLLSLKNLSSTISFHLPQEPKGMKVMSWNVKNFDLYNWSKNKETRLKMMNLIDSINPDVLCLQEFYTDNEKNDNVTALSKLGYRYHSFYPSYTQKDGSRWGLAIFSKYELTQPKAIALNPNKASLNQCVRASVKFNKRIYHIYNAHFQSIHLDYEDLDYIQDVKKEWTIMDKWRSWRVLYKILSAYKNRTEQIETLFSKHISEDKLIFCCDLNDIPVSYAYQLLHARYQDAFTRRGIGLSPTIAVGVPLYRIDYIFTSHDIAIHGYERHVNTLSDHHAIISYIE